MNDWIQELQASIEIGTDACDKAILNFVKVGLIGGYLSLEDVNGKTREEFRELAKNVYVEASEGKAAYWDPDFSEFEMAYVEYAATFDRININKKRLAFLMKHQTEEI